MDYKDINLKKVEVLEGKVYHNYIKMTFYTPEMYLPYGLNKYDNKWGEKYEIKASFRDAQGRYLKNFHNKMKGLEEIFKKVYPNTEYHSFIKSGNLVLKVPYMKGHFTCGVKSDLEALPTIFSIKPGCVVRFLVSMDRFWNYQGRSGCVAVIKEIFIIKNP